MIILLIIVGISLLILNIWNLITLNHLNKNLDKTDNQLNDSKYFELKYKSEFIIAVFSIIIAVGGLLGYNTLKSAKNEIKSNLISKTKSIDSTLNQTAKRIEKKDSILEKIILKQKLINESIPLNDEKIRNQENRINSIQNTINELNENNKIKQSFYLIKSIKLIEDEQIFYFKDLRTTIDDRLPKFSKIPFIIPISEKFHIVDVFDITLEGFTAGSSLMWGLSNTKNNGDITFGIMIIENK